MHSGKKMNLRLLVERSSPLEERIRDVEFIKERYPNHCPVFVRHGNTDRVWRHVMPCDKNFSLLIHRVRKARQVPPSVGLAFLVETPGGGQVQVPASMDFGRLEREFSHKDGFIYVNVVEQNVFG
jgi:hypothetical protein